MLSGVVVDCSCTSSRRLLHASNNGAVGRTVDNRRLDSRAALRLREPGGLFHSLVDDRVDDSGMTVQCVLWPKHLPRRGRVPAASRRLPQCAVIRPIGIERSTNAVLSLSFDGLV